LDGRMGLLDHVADYATQTAVEALRTRLLGVRLEEEHMDSKTEPDTSQAKSRNPWPVIVVVITMVAVLVVGLLVARDRSCDRWEDNVARATATFSFNPTVASTLAERLYPRPWYC